MPTFDTDALEAIIQKYEADIEEVRKNELYKWEAAYCFKQHWNASASDFAAMLDSALSKADNLLVGAMYYPKGMLSIFAHNDPAAVRKAMVALFDESKPLRQRLEEFSSKAAEMLDRENALRSERGDAPAKNHFQDPRAMSVYLAFANTGENYLYKTEMYRKFARTVGVDYPGNKFDKVVAYRELCDDLLAYLEENHPSLIEKSDGLLAPEYADIDPNHHILVQDIVYYVDAYMGHQSEYANSNQDGAGESVRYWVYAPGEQAWAWQECLDEGVMLLGWDYLGDLAQYKDRDEIAGKLREIEGTDGSKMNDSLACWQFQNELKPGDIVYAKRGLYSIVGKGVVKSEAWFASEREHYNHARGIEWVATGEWDVRNASIPMGNGTAMKTLPMKTLTEWTMYPDAVAAMEALIAGKTVTDTTDGGPRRWWLTANPKIWSFSDISIGDEQSYTLYNEKGNPRRILKNLLAAQPGDMVVGYESQPTKRIVALCEISRPHDEERMYFKKVRDLVGEATYEAFKDDATLSDMEFMKNPNGSFFALTEAEYARIMDYFEDEASPVASMPDKYADEDFLSDVFMEPAEFEELKSLLQRKQNVILQGAPGTGKTYAAKRLAWAMMGCKDASRVQQVQFHQSTSYDDFVYGYRPNEAGGFETVPGVFTEICRRAASRPNEDFFFIIDEVNRANISKVFGELLMLIESDHRGESVVLPVSGERFRVPENVDIIGMMNTADRGLALIDYALRRRFAFFEMEPALGNERFLEAAGEAMAPLVSAVRKLNEAIAADPALGRGFRIGHSYFCPGKGGPADPASVVKYELAPLVEEYWFDDEKRARDEVAKLQAAAS